jgi:DNA-binding NtrC family response regulator
MKGIEDDALEVLTQYRWPGNIRELQNTIKRALVLAKTDYIKVDDLPGQIVGQNCCAEELFLENARGFFLARSQKTDHFEVDYFKNLLTQCNCDITLAAHKALRPRGTLYRLLKKHDLSPEVFRK